MSTPDREHISKLRADYAYNLAAYKVGDWSSTHEALKSAVVYIEELERWVGCNE
jgi:hypothetical protein